MKNCLSSVLAPCSVVSWRERPASRRVCPPAVERATPLSPLEPAFGFIAFGLERRQEREADLANTIDRFTGGASDGSVELGLVHDQFLSIET